MFMSKVEARDDIVKRIAHQVNSLDDLFWTIREILSDRCAIDRHTDTLASQTIATKTTRRLDVL
jgi:hypothetical protein